MTRWPHILALFLLSGGVLTLGISPELRAATSATPDIPSNDRAGDAAAAVDVGTVRPIAWQNNRDPVKPAPSGNPLWSVPVSGGFDTSYAPFVPRSTPKNGESDGL